MKNAEKRVPFLFVLVIFLLGILVFPLEAFSKEKTLKPAAPFSKNRDRYEKLFEELRIEGMDDSRLIRIFASEKAKKKDPACVKILSRPVTVPAALYPPEELQSIVEKMKRHIQKYAKSYDELERQYGINKEIGAAVFYKETLLGEFNNWKHDAFIVLNNLLSFLEAPENAGRRQKKRIQRIVSFSRKSMKGLLLYCEKYGIDVTRHHFPSSFAGAVGIPQFMPMYLHYAKTRANPHPDLNSMPDAILSFGNLVKNEFNWPEMMDLEKLGQIDALIKAYVDYNQKNKNISFFVSQDLDGFPLTRFVDEFDQLSHIDYIARFGAILMSYNYSSHYVLDVLQLAYHCHKSGLSSTK